jgi:hypothetical protein
MQIVYKGRTDQVLPKGPIKKLLEEGGHHLTTNPHNHWSSEKTMERFVVRILEPYYHRVKLEKDLPSSVKLIWLIDCWPVHTSNEFMDYMKNCHGTWLKFLFVPAKCTSTCQPCDVALNRPFKAAFRFAFQKWAIEESEAKFQNKDKSAIDFGAIAMKTKSAEYLPTSIFFLLP